MTIPNLPLPDELADLRAKIKAFEQREGEIRALLLSNPDTRTGANWLADIKVVTQSRVDLKELRACHPDIVEQFEFPTEITRIVLMGIDQDTGEVVSARKMRATAGADQ
jgi:hypothetical protein